jgi:replicative DNA helicase
MVEAKNSMKIAPNSKESEMMVLGCMLTSINSLNLASDALSNTDFYYSEHKIVFLTLQTAFRMDKPADVHIISEELRRQDKLDSVGGIPYITTLAQYAGTSAYIEEYIAIVKNKSLLRNMIHAAQLVEKTALEEPENVYGSLDEAQQLFFKISQFAAPSKGVTVSEVFSGQCSKTSTPYLKELEERQAHFLEHGADEGGVTGIRTHLDDLDTMINGFNKSNLMILAGRPGMGKTALALNIAENICFKEKIPVGVFSLEMSAEQLTHRIVCSQSEVESEKILTGSLNGVEFQRVLSAVNQMQETPFVIDDQPGLSITDLRARARRMKETYNVGALVIDYLQLLTGTQSSKMPESRQVEIAEISRMLKNLARELDIPVLCGSQLSRKVEERQGHRPMMSDLRESGSIEQDADLIMFLLRREYYDANDKPGTAELIIGKNRHGAVGNVNLTFRKEIVQFANYTPIDYMINPEEAESNTEAFSAFSQK